MKTKQSNKEDGEVLNKATKETRNSRGVIYSLSFSICLLFLLSFSSALICDPTIPGGCPTDKPVSPIIAGANYSINVNNTEHLQGRDTNSLYSYFQGLFDAVYCKLTGCEMTGDIDMGRNNIINISKTTYINSSYGIWSNETDIVIGFIGGL